jgi:hypothetical protein
MKIKNVFFLLLFVINSLSVQSQLVIGSDIVPDKWAALELFSDSGGLRYPQLSETQRNALGDLSNTSAAYGLMIFNATNSNMEYVRESAGWTVLYDPLPVPPHRNLVLGLTGPAPIIAPISSNLERTYTVAFTPDQITNGVTNLEVGKYLDFNNIVQSVEWTTGPAIGTTNTLKVTFRPKVVALAAGRTIANPLRFTLYATYLEDGIKKEADFEVLVTGS